MRVKAKVGFVHKYPEGDDRIWLMVQVDQVLEMPEGADWLDKGLVVPVAEVAPGVEKAVEKRAHAETRRRGKGKS